MKTLADKPNKQRQRPSQPLEAQPAVGSYTP